MQNVDLNPVRANIAKTPETSDFTSAQDRIVDAKTADEVSTPDARDKRIEHGKRGAIPKHLSGILQRLDMSPAFWVDYVR